MLFTKLAVISFIGYSSTVLSAPLQKRESSTCSFPTNDGLVAVTPSSSNGGWAMSPDQQCTGGSYCPYACPPGKLMAQWDPQATSYTYPESQYGGLYCNNDGTVSKPFSDKDYCVDGEGTVSVKNSANGGSVAFCQTVLPGNEAMLIPTEIGSDSSESIAVPGPDYWASTSAHYYINAPGVSASDGCVWGSSSSDKGNWAPYVAGANTDSSGNTYVKIGWNPIYVEAFNNVKPNFGLRITCDNDSDCTGLDCEIDPSKTGFNTASGSSSDNQEGAAFCIVTAKNYNKANIEVFST